jgi:hypothetical protein
VLPTCSGDKITEHAQLSLLLLLLLLRRRRRRRRRRRLPSLQLSER